MTLRWRVLKHSSRLHMLQSKLKAVPRSERDSGSPPVLAAREAKPLSYLRKGNGFVRLLLEDNDLNASTMKQAMNLLLNCVERD